MSDERFLVSGWEDDLNDIDSSRNPEEKIQEEFMNACENGMLELVKALLEKRPDLIYCTDKDKYTPLHRACYSNHIKVVEYLLQNGAKLGAETEMKWQPLHSCCQWNTVDCAAILIRCGADVNAKSQGGLTPLHVAASYGASYNTVQMLLMHQFINPLIKNNNGETAKEIATRSSRFYNVFDIADPLLDYENARKLK